MRVAYWNNIAPPYMHIRWEAANQSSAHRLEVWVNRQDTPQYEWLKSADRSYELRVNPSITKFGRRFCFPWLAITRDVDAVVTLYGDLEFLLGILAFRARRIPYYLWSEAVSPAHRRSDKLKTLRSFVRSWIFRNAAGYFTPGPDADKFVIHNGGASSKIVRLHHIVEHGKEGSRAEDAKESSLLRCAYVGRLVDGKGIDVALRAIAGPDRRSRLEIVGSGPLQRSLRQLTQELEIDDRVVFTGFLQPEDMDDLYARTDCLILPSEADTYALVVDEALARGVYPIVSDVVGEIHDRLSSYEIGQTFPVADVATLANILLRLESEGTPGTPGLRRAVVEANTADRWAAVLWKSLERRESPVRQLR